VCKNFLHRGHDRDQQFLFAARAVRLRFDDDLVLRINGGYVPRLRCALFWALDYVQGWYAAT
jgi:hypothetical protein